MPVTTRSQINTNMTTRVSEKAAELQPKKISNPNLVAPRPPQPKLQVSFLTQEEFDARNYEMDRMGGRVNGLLTTISLPAINNDPEDWLKYEIYVPEGYVKPDNKIYVVAPDGYYWEHRHSSYGGHYFDLDKISNRR